MKHKYVCMKYQHWANMEALTPARQPVKGPGRSTGCLLVYDTLAALKLDHPDAEYVKVANANKKAR